MARIFDGATVTVNHVMKAAISDAMHGNANDLISALNNQSTGKYSFYLAWATDPLSGYNYKPIEKVYITNASKSNNLLDYIFTVNNTASTDDVTNVPTTSIYVGYKEKSDDDPEFVKNYSGSLVPLFTFSKITLHKDIWMFEIRISV